MTNKFSVDVVEPNSDLLWLYWPLIKQFPDIWSSMTFTTLRGSFEDLIRGRWIDVLGFNL